MASDTEISLSSSRGRLVLAAVTLSAGAVFLDSTIVNVAGPRIQDDLAAPFTTIQWVIDAYLITLGSLVLVGGALGDLLGRKRVYLVGVAGFAAASMACGVAPNATALVIARAVQGVFAAIVAPSGLAIINSTYQPSDRSRAIGLWTALGAAATALGPLVGGVLVDSGPGGWRWAFFLNLPLMLAAFIAARMAVPSLPGLADRTQPLRRQVDARGAVLVTVGLMSIAFTLIEWTRIDAQWRVGIGVIGVLAILAFLASQRTADVPMMPLDLWRNREFAALGVMTFLLYGALAGWLFLQAVVLQRALGYSALEAGLVALPLTIVLALGSSSVGRLMRRVDGRTLLVIGSLLTSAALLLQTRLTAESSYWTAILPGVLLFSLGFVLIVVPITSMTLAAAPTSRSGVAAGISNANARISGLIAVAALPLVAGISAEAFPAPDRLIDGYHVALIAGAVMCLASAAIAGVWLSHTTSRE